MGISGTTHALMPAAAGLARAGATRSDWHPAGTRMPLYALSGIARSGATRSGYHGPRAFISIDGVPHTGGTRADATQPGILIDSLDISDLLDQAPNRCAFTAWRFRPSVGQQIIITLGSVNNRNRLFAGRILNTEQFYLQTPLNECVGVNAIDDTWGLNTRKVSERYTATTFAAIVADLVSKYAAVGYSVAVEAGLGSIDEISFTNLDLTDALTQLAKRGGYYWLCDEQRVVRMFRTDLSVTAPTILNAAHRTLWEFHVTRDLSQVVTRVYVEGAGTVAFAAMAPGETILAVEDTTYFEALGGTVVCGPQRLVYTGKYAGGGGGLVGTGAAPSGAPVLALASGAGLADGTRSYGVTFVTPAGESISGPLATITSGVTPAPTTAPTAAAPTIGTGPDPGSHDYAVTFVTSSGETTAGPTVTRATDITAAPVAFPIPGTPTTGTGPDDGQHDYAVTFVTSIGETTPSPISAAVTTGPLPAPASGPTGTPSFGTGPETGSHEYAVTFVTSAGETTSGPRTTIATGLTDPPASAPTLGTATAGAGPDLGSHDYAVSFVTSVGETVPGPIGTTVIDPVGPPPAPTTQQDIAGANLTVGGSYEDVSAYSTASSSSDHTHETTPGPASTPIAAITDGAGGSHALLVRATYSSDAGVLWLHVYRRVNGGAYHLVITFANNPAGTTTTQQDFLSDASIAGAVSPSSTNTAVTHQTVPLTAIPIGDANVTSRKLYRTAAGLTQLKLLAALANNTATTYTDTTPDVSLGANALTVSTAALNRIALAAIPIGPANVTQRKIYRTAIGSAQLKLVTTLTNNTVVTYADTTIDASLGANVPTSNTAAMNQVPLTGIPVGDANVTSRKIYRRSGGSGLKLLTTIANNFTTTYLDTTANASLGAAVPSSTTAYIQRIALSAIPLGSALVTSRKIYRTAAGGVQLKLLTTIANNTATTFADTITDASLGANVPVTNTATANQVALSSIPIGASAVTQRKIYRTIAGGSQLKLLTTLADNSTATYTDSTADGSLGANVPIVDTSGLAQPQGNVIAGSTSLQIASIGTFPTAGWAVIGNGQQVIRYTGVSGNVLTGIPASGPGSIQATIAYNSTVTASPQLIGVPASGVGAIRYGIVKGDPVNLWVQVDDVPAQATLAALMGTDGIIEDYLQDRRLSHTECVARGRAQLALRSLVEVSVTYRCRDLRTRAGRTVPVNLPSQGVVGNFKIQQVTISGFGVPNLLPTFTASASTSRFSFEDLLRVARKANSS